MYNTLLLTIVTILYIRSLGHIHLIVESLYAMTSISFSSPLGPGSHHSTLFLWIQLFFVVRFQMWVRSYAVWLISPTSVFSKFFHKWQNCCLSYDLIVLHCGCIYVCVCLYNHIVFVHSSIKGHLGCFHVLAIVVNATTNFKVQIIVSTVWFHFLLMFTQKWYCWITW